MSDTTTTEAATVDQSIADGAATETGAESAAVTEGATALGDAGKKALDAMKDKWHASRDEALALLRPVRSLADVYASYGGRDGVTVWATAARAPRDTLSFVEARRELELPGKPVVILFGTAWGLPNELLAEVDALLPPLGAREGRGDGYKHLSVRAACALTLDRLLGER